MTQTFKITREDVLSAIDIYSADLSRWPQEMIKPALALMAQDAPLARLFDKAVALDDMLRAETPPPCDLDALKSRVLAALDDQPQVPDLPAAAAVSPRGWALPGGGLFIVAVVGFVIGFSPAQQQAAAQDVFAADLPAASSLFEEGIF